MKKIFLTGGNGFIGRNVLEKLGGKYSFFAPSSKELDLQNADAVASYIRIHKFDLVIHSAKYGGTRKISDVAETAEYNTRMFFNIVRNKAFFKKMIFLGSGAEYGHYSRPIVKVKEKEFDSFVPQDSFGFFKYICSKYIENVDNIINLRLFGIFGKYEDYELRFISNAICKNILGLPITLRQNVYFDYLYIDDFIKILEYFIEHSVQEKFYNVGTGTSIDLKKVTQIINKISKKPSKVIISKTGLSDEYTCDNSRLLSEIGDFKFTNIEDSIADLCTWYKNKQHTLRKESFFVDI